MSTTVHHESNSLALPVACSLGASELAQRGASVRHELFRHAVERQELPDGLRYRFPGSDDVKDKLLAFAAAERTCCAFFRIELAFEPGLGPIWLTLTGPVGVKEFIRQTFDVEVAGPDGVGPPALAVPRISREELKGRLDRGEATTLVEALPEPYYRRAHLPGAINIPADRVTELAPRLLPDLDAEIVVYCADLACPSSGLVARTLQDLGYRSVREYAEGKQDWIAAALPTERGFPGASATPEPTGVG
ncbi:MAG: rhodanese-like domain-containing protein [Thermomicrobiales bacterium]|nr:rhodanese-like domain-containing protein [Thermomicrobiales bacterium]